MEIELTSSELLQALRANKPEDKLNVDTNTIKYAVYARKSTQGDEKQERSIDDQIRECVDKVMRPNDIQPVQVIQERYSAKEPDTRVHFKALINDIKAGRITGLVAWHPDRLARNMKDAGEIIDLLDKGVLRDLRFATSTFENNPTGKMLLGISFVLSKQYSEHLSESVLRGNQRATEDDGVFLGKFKHGYYVDTSTRHLLPDESTFTLVKQMFQMRLAGSNQREIGEWINKQGYMLRKAGKDPAPFIWNKDDVSNLLKDPVYAGVLRYGVHTVDLTDKYDFSPMITVNDYYKLNKHDIYDSSKIIATNRIKRTETQANLLRGMVYCGHCKKPFTSMLIPKKVNGELVSTRYYYKCENKACELYGKSAPAKTVIKAASDFFAKYLFTTQDNYDSYIKNAKEEIRIKNKQIDAQVGSMMARIKKVSADYEDTKNLLKSSPLLEKHYDLDSIKNEENELRQQHADLIAQRTAASNTLLSYENYLKLFSSSSVILTKIQDMEEMDSLIRMFFSNFTITGKDSRFVQGSEVTFELKEPWKGFIKDEKFVYGAGKETLTPGLILGKDAL